MVVLLLLCHNVEFQQFPSHSFYVNSNLKQFSKLQIPFELISDRQKNSRVSTLWSGSSTYLHLLLTYSIEMWKRILQEASCLPSLPLPSLFFYIFRPFFKCSACLPLVLFWWIQAHFKGLHVIENDTFQPWHWCAPKSNLRKLENMPFLYLSHMR